METAEFWRLGRVSDERLQRGLAELLASGYRTEARIVAHIAEVEERKLHLRDGSESLFDYCTTRLGLSNSEAFHRITAARIARQFPAVFTLLERRELHLTAVCLLRDYLTPGNHRELLAAAHRKTKLQIQEMLASRFPRPDVESRIRKLPETRALPRGEAPSAGVAPSVPLVRTLSSPSLVGPTPAPTGFTPPPQRAPAVTPRGLVEPTSEARYRIQLNASAALKEKLELLRALTSHSNAEGDLAVVIERAVDLALERAQRERFAKTDSPRQPAGRRLITRAAAARLTRGHIPNATQREVVARDGMRCSYVGDSGHRCTARAFLQIHHEHPWARGGADDAENLRVLCRPHNRLLAERDFGAAHVAKRIALRQTDANSGNGSVSAPPRRRHNWNRRRGLAQRSTPASGQERTICARSLRRIEREASGALSVRVSANRSPPPARTTPPVAQRRCGAEPNHPAALRPAHFAQTKWLRRAGNTNALRGASRDRDRPPPPLTIISRTGTKCGVCGVL